MSYQYITSHTTVNYTKGGDKKKYIVIHYTGNRTDTAKANASYFKSKNRGASAHIFVDKNYACEVVGLDDTAWAVGVNYGKNNLFGTCTNRNSISIEMCSDNGKISDKTFENTVAVTKKIMKKYNIKPANVIRHYDVCSKSCPGWNGWIGKDESLWKKFKKEIQSASNGVTVKTKCKLYKKSSIVSGSYGTLETGRQITFIKDNQNGWSKVCAAIRGKEFTGYVKNTCVTEKSKLSHYRKGTVCVSSAPVRAKNKKSSKKLGTVKKGSVFNVVSVGKFWTNVKYKGKDGFISNKKISIGPK